MIWVGGMLTQEAAVYFLGSLYDVHLGTGRLPDGEGDAPDNNIMYCSRLSCLPTPKTTTMATTDKSAGSSCLLTTKASGLRSTEEHRNVGTLSPDKAAGEQWLRLLPSRDEIEKEIEAADSASHTFTIDGTESWHNTETCAKLSLWMHRTQCQNDNSLMVNPYVPSNV